jgi:hypothetical protein
MDMQKIVPNEAQNAINSKLLEMQKKAKADGIKQYEVSPLYKDITDPREPGYAIARRETDEHKRYRLDVMKTAIAPLIYKAMEKMAPQYIKGCTLDPELLKTTLNVASNMTPYDLMAPAKTLVPWLTPLVEATPRVHRATPGSQAHWKSIINTASSFNRGGAPAMAWINEGQRAPLLALNLSNQNATYASLGVDVNVSYEAESASVGFEDAIAAAHFFSLETLRDKEEVALLGGNNSLTLGTANTPTGSFVLSSASSVSSYSSYASSGTYYASCVGLTFEGWYNNQLQFGTSPSSISQQTSLTTLDSKVMTVNYGCGQNSVVSSISSGSSGVFTFTANPKNGEVAYAWYLGTTGSSTSSLYFAGITTSPIFNYSASSAPSTTTQPLSALTTGDFSVNNGSLGGGTNQVTAFDGFLTQCWNNTNLTPQNAYTINLKGAFLTSSGAGSVNEIDTMLISMWNNYKVTVDVLYVNAQELQNITKRILNNNSAPLLRAMIGSESGFDLVASGVISFYHNPYIPGGRKIPIIIHPKISPGTIFAQGKVLPQYFKANNTANISEVLARREYYTKEWADVTREYQSGVYLEEVLACYAPFALGILTGIGNG